MVKVVPSDSYSSSHTPHSGKSLDGYANSVIPVPKKYVSPFNGRPKRKSDSYNNGGRPIIASKTYSRKSKPTVSGTGINTKYAKKTYCNSMPSRTTTAPSSPFDPNSDSDSDNDRDPRVYSDNNNNSDIALDDDSPYKARPLGKFHRTSGGGTTGQSRPNLTASGQDDFAIMTDSDDNSQSTDNDALVAAIEATSSDDSDDSDSTDDRRHRGFKSSKTHNGHLRGQKRIAESTTRDNLKEKASDSSPHATRRVENSGAPKPTLAKKSTIASQNTKLLPMRLTKSKVKNHQSSGILSSSEASSDSENERSLPNQFKVNKEEEEEDASEDASEEVDASDDASEASEEEDDDSSSDSSSSDDDYSNLNAYIPPTLRKHNTARKHLYGFNNAGGSVNGTPVSSRQSTPVPPTSPAKKTLPGNVELPSRLSDTTKTTTAASSNISFKSKLKATQNTTVTTGGSAKLDDQLITNKAKNAATSKSLRDSDSDSSNLSSLSDIEQELQRHQETGFAKSMHGHGTNNANIKNTNKSKSKRRMSVVEKYSDDHVTFPRDTDLPSKLTANTTTTDPTTVNTDKKIDDKSKKEFWFDDHYCQQTLLYPEYDDGIDGMVIRDILDADAAQDEYSQDFNDEALMALLDGNNNSENNGDSSEENAEDSGDDADDDEYYYYDYDMDFSSIVGGSYDGGGSGSSTTASTPSSSFPGVVTRENKDPNNQVSLERSEENSPRIEFKHNGRFSSGDSVGVPSLVAGRQTYRNNDADDENENYGEDDEDEDDDEDMSYEIHPFLDLNSSRTTLSNAARAHNINNNKNNLHASTGDSTVNSTSRSLYDKSHIPNDQDDDYSLWTAFFEQVSKGESSEDEDEDEDDEDDSEDSKQLDSNKPELTKKHLAESGLQLPGNFKISTSISSTPSANPLTANAESTKPAIVEDDLDLGGLQLPGMLNQRSRAKVSVKQEQPSQQPEQSSAIMSGDSTDEETNLPLPNNRRGQPRKYSATLGSGGSVGAGGTNTTTSRPPMLASWVMNSTRPFGIIDGRSTTNLVNIRRSSLSNHSGHRMSGSGGNGYRNKRRFSKLDPIDATVLDEFINTSDLVDFDDTKFKGPDGGSGIVFGNGLGGRFARTAYNNSSNNSNNGKGSNNNENDGLDPLQKPKPTNTGTTSSDRYVPSGVPLSAFRNRGMNNNAHSYYTYGYAGPTGPYSSSSGRRISINKRDSGYRRDSIGNSVIGVKGNGRRMSISREVLMSGNPMSKMHSHLLVKKQKKPKKSRKDKDTAARLYMPNDCASSSGLISDGNLQQSLVNHLESNKKKFPSSTYHGSRKRLKQFDISIKNGMDAYDDMEDIFSGLDHSHSGYDDNISDGLDFIDEDNNIIIEHDDQAPEGTTDLIDELLETGKLGSLFGDFN
ncbi:hypothetical protein NADFUDRAFT_45165 [Nadsonia fulvescens var. elongata DSM 6958]|uniref:Uncharacterized protein n=1 Tax=Nadsonia fulvescens var. elongata DSM 6958 TaxID=857566 RepID=A0A1E3PUQ2_9ASCO|nr:hypothetical protein NADFUDRAFT_45165 [Nadsonia fulvescens var. elongata DSM 6958]